MTQSGYVVAGFETLATIINNFIKNTKNRYESNFSREDISDFLLKTCSGFLHSYGQNFAMRRSYSKFNKSEATLFKNCREFGLFDGSLLITDSGGYQVSIGLAKDTTKLLLRMFYDFLEEHHEVLDRAFILDLIPGPNCVAFDSFDEVEKMNIESYTKAAGLSPDVIKKIIYIHHFRTPRLWEIFLKLLREYDLFSKFNHFGVGGMVANLAGDLAIPCIVYVLPLVILLNECKRSGLNALDFHILGGATFRDVFFYELFKIHIRNKHNIEVNITYDSSGLYKGLMVGRYIHVLDNNIIHKVDIKSTNLDKRFKGGTKVVDIYIQEMNQLFRKFNFKEVGKDGIYSSETGTFFEEIKVYTMLHMLNQYSEIQSICKESAEKVYIFYENGFLEEFTNSVIDITKNLNGGKITKKQRIKSYSIAKSLDILTNLDEEYCEYLVSKFLSKDEFSKLEDNGRVLTI